MVDYFDEYSDYLGESYREERTPDPVKGQAVGALRVTNGHCRRAAVCQQPVSGKLLVESLRRLRSRSW